LFLSKIGIKVWMNQTKIEPGKPVREREAQHRNVPA
jgi:hypothetical protein